MKTSNCKKVHMYEELLEIVENIRRLKAREEEIKTIAKNDIGVGLLETDNVIVLIEERTRTSLDRAALEKHLGVEHVREFEKETTFLQVNVKRKAV